MLQKTQESAAGTRRARILDAAARCFVRTGFHRTTMQDVALEAEMSPGNLYRYFPSKAAIVEGLAERDGAELAADFDAFGSGDFMANFAALGRKHFDGDARDKAVLCLQIWAEATRDPAFRAITDSFEHDVRTRLVGLVEQAKARGEVAPGCDPTMIAHAIQTLANGLYVRRAVLSDFDPQREIPIVMSLILALMQGGVDLAGAPEPMEMPS